MNRSHPFITLTFAILAAYGIPHSTLADPPRPNVLFLIVDDMTTTMSCQQWPGARTPNIDILAARGVRFERAYCQFSVCNPARASFLTGCYPEKTKVMDLSTSFRDALPEVVTLPQHFKNNGYRTAAIGKDGLQLYDLPIDPHQLSNLAGQEAHLPMQSRLKRLLTEQLARATQ